MTIITGSGNCGNSPKNRLAEELTIALAQANEAEIRARVTEEVAWRRVGGETNKGADALLAAVEALGPARELIIEQALSHGRAGAVNGTLRYATAEEAFCHIFQFNNAKGARVAAITTYAIPRP
ncbi:MAG: hypothetical protein H6642_02445 [Caldilineaceae bacterium]|nr:hypothetical protein [Caldilineaceae bacterium]